MMNYIKLFKIIVLIFILLASCQKFNSNQEFEERAKILELHNLQRDYHFKSMAKEFAFQLSKNIISVNGGVIKNSNEEENVTKFNNYFNSVTFEKWDDINPPIIRFSNDLSLAYTIVNKQVIVSYNNEFNKKVKEKTEFSWVAIYKKYPEGWKIDCIASTNLPSEIINIIN